MVEVEIWKDVVGYEGLYQVSNMGNVKSLDRWVNSKGNGERFLEGQPITTELNKFGYWRTRLRKNGERQKVFQTHRLVAMAFIPNPDNKPCVNHINGMRTDNRLDNLEWCTHSENTKHMYDTLGYVHPEERRNKISKCFSKRVCVNGEEFPNLKTASLHHKKNKHYFTNVLCRKKQDPTKYPQWEIEVLD